MRIVQVIPGSLYQGGIGSFVRYLSIDIAKHGHQVSIYCVDNSTYAETDEFKKNISLKVFRYVLGDPFYMPLTDLITSLRTEKADVIHVHNIHTVLPAYLGMLKRCFQGELVLHPHYHVYGQNIVRDLFFKFYKKMLYYHILPNYRAIVVNSNYEEEAFKRDFPHVSSTVILIPEEYLITIPPQLKWVPSLELKKILYVGTLRKYKNVDILFHAFRILNSRRKDVELHIIGDGPEKEKLIELACKLGIQNKIIMRANLSYDELLQEYANSNVVVLLSRLESFSRVAHEATTIGVPLIVYAQGILCSIVKKGLAKAVYSLDPVEVANAINEVLNGDWKPSHSTLQVSTQKRKYSDLIIKLYEKILDIP